MTQKGNVLIVLLSHIIFVSLFPMVSHKTAGGSESGVL